MQSKYLRLSIFFRPFINRLIIIILLIVLSMLFWKKSKAQIIQLEKIDEQRRLVEQTPQFKKQISILELEQMQEIIEERASEKVKINLVLSGIIIKNNIPSVLINDGVYEEGDSVDNFIITKIYINKSGLPYIIVKDKNTNQSEIMYLYLTQ